ncbi:MAG: hypothetical protein PHF33_01700 [Candidatus Delongbacteria bacterium]|jgi:hypothetical protein|nr:hypothetical protein [Candidatus Delongbacteria bacterium]MDD4204873.1 hypothetical protein [Candidatus Delongbacteria bacterium]MDY0017126.1 hypothetical protein [Candidatus Delongbacteria bacterium]
MYKFNFLSKINQEKIETRKRESFIRMLFLCFASAMVLLLGLLYLFGLSVNTDNRIAKENRQQINDKINILRSGEYFSYKLSQNMYNSMAKRTKISDVINTVESSMDSTVLINNFQYDGDYLEVTFISRSSNVKSQLMSWMVSFKDQVEEKMIKMGLCEKNNLKLAKGPDIKKQFEDYTYWMFVLSLEFPKKEYNLAKGKKR